MSSPSPSPSLPSREPPTFTTLPTELHLLIASNLTYPDALALKHTNQHFYSLVYTGVKLKIDWLVERRGLHLDCPTDKGCDLGSDQRFCRGSLELLMRRRREHFECDTREGGRGCLIFGSKICTSKKKPLSNLEKMRKFIAKFGSLQLSVPLWWLVVAFLGVALAWCCVLRNPASTRNENGSVIVDGMS